MEKTQTQEVKAKSEDVKFNRNVNKKFGNESVVYKAYPATASIKDILLAKMANGNHGSDKFRTEILKVKPYIAG